MHSQQKRRYTKAYCIQHCSIYPHARLSKGFCGLYTIQVAPLFNKWRQTEQRHGALEECTNMWATFGAATAVHESCGGVFLVWLGRVVGSFFRIGCYGKLLAESRQVLGMFKAQRGRLRSLCMRIKATGCRAACFNSRDGRL